MMSSPLPWGIPSTMSMSTTSLTSRSAKRWARDAPTLPPPTIVTFRFMDPSSEVLDDRGGELGRLQDRGPFHLTLEVVGDALLADGLLERLLDGVRGLPPAQVAQHHAAGEDDGARVHLVEVGVLGRGAVGGLEDRVAGLVVDVSAG